MELCDAYGKATFDDLPDSVQALGLADLLYAGRDPARALFFGPNPPLPEPEAREAERARSRGAPPELKELNFEDEVSANTQAFASK